METERESEGSGDNGGRMMYWETSRTSIKGIPALVLHGQQQYFFWTQNTLNNKYNIHKNNINIQTDGKHGILYGQ